MHHSQRRGRQHYSKLTYICNSNNNNNSDSYSESINKNSVVGGVERKLAALLLLTALTALVTLSLNFGSVFVTQLQQQHPSAVRRNKTLDSTSSSAAAAIVINWRRLDNETQVVNQTSDGSSFAVASKPSRALPNVLVIGSRKCGTRALLKFLELHPNVVAANKEVHFFDNATNYARGLQWYKQQMPSLRRSPDNFHVVVVEKTPAYFSTRNVPRRVFEMNPRIKLLLIVRNPVTRLISDYSQLCAKKNKKQLAANETQVVRKYAENDEQIWAQHSQNFEQTMASLFGGCKQSTLAKQWASLGFYDVHLANWLKYFAASQIHVVDGERFIKEPHVELKRVEQFLNLKSQIDERNFVFVASKKFFCVRRITNHANNFSDNTKNSSSEVSVECLGKNKGRKHISVSNALVEKLERFYELHTERFYSLSGVQFRW